MDCCRSCDLQENNYGAVIKWYFVCTMLCRFMMKSQNIKQEAKDETGKWKKITTS